MTNNSYAGSYAPALLPGGGDPMRGDMGRTPPVRRIRSLTNAESWRRYALRAGGVYRLRDGTRFVARPLNGDAWDLLTTNNLTWSPRQGEYRLEADGSITYRGRKTAWTRADLLDMGSTVPSLAAGA